MFESGSNMLFSLGKGHSLEKLKGLKMWRLSLIGSTRQTRLLHSTTVYDKTGHAPSSLISRLDQATQEEETESFKPSVIQRQKSEF